MACVKKGVAKNKYYNLLEFSSLNNDLFQGSNRHIHGKKQANVCTSEGFHFSAFVSKDKYNYPN